MEGNDVPRKKREMDPNDPMAIIAQSMLADQADKVAERENKKRQKNEAIRQNQIQEDDKATKAARMQRVCDHLLGNHKIGVVPDVRRSHLHMHRLSDASVYIYCGKCRAKWMPGDTREHFKRVDGQGPILVPNPTRMGWNDIRKFFYTFPNAKDLTSIAFRVERLDPEDMDVDPEPVELSA